MHDPPILILDEPTSGLDPLQIRETLSLIRELGDQHTILLSTHILSEVEAICQRVIIISAGRIGLDKKMSELGADGNVILVEVRGPFDQVMNVLQTTDGVAAAGRPREPDGLVSCEVRTKNNQDLRELVAQRLTRNGWGLRQLDMRRRKLEDHFIEVAMGHQAAAAADVYRRKRPRRRRQPGRGA